VRRNCASRNQIIVLSQPLSPYFCTPVDACICCTLLCRPPHRMCPDVVRKGYGMLQAYLAKQVEVRYPVSSPPCF
jgi:hypothetical protein